MKATGGSHEWSGKRDGQLDAVRPDFWDVNISFYPSLPVGDGGRVALQYMACSNIAVVEDVDVTLDDLVGLRREMPVNDRMWVRDLSKK